jgi:hypothetical protein
MEDEVSAGDSSKLYGDDAGLGMLDFKLKEEMQEFCRTFLTSFNTNKKQADRSSLKGEVCCVVLCCVVLCCVMLLVCSFFCLMLCE